MMHFDTYCCLSLGLVVHPGSGVSGCQKWLNYHAVIRSPAVLDSGALG
uniref:Uncharacterized protein n=1 Tax=Anguilla anguilla TaxID=7936 RepID=A0A0E9PUN6_ANGAN